MTSSTMTSATPSSAPDSGLSALGLGVGSGHRSSSTQQVQVARRHVELNFQIGHVAAAGAGRAAAREQQPDRTSKRRERGLDSKRESDAAYPKKIRVEAIRCAASGHHGPSVRSAGAISTSAFAAPSAVRRDSMPAVNQSEHAVLSCWPTVDGLARSWRRGPVAGSKAAAPSPSFVDQTRRQRVTEVAKLQLHDVIEHGLGRIECVSTYQLIRAGCRVVFERVGDRLDLGDVRTRGELARRRCASQPQRPPHPRHDRRRRRPTSAPRSNTSS